VTFPPQGIESAGRLESPICYPVGRTACTAGNKGRDPSPVVGGITALFCYQQEANGKDTRLVMGQRLTGEGR
jgi:hypothetical protein